MRITEKMKENRRKEDQIEEEWKKACKNANSDKQFNTVYNNVVERMKSIRELGIECHLIIPGVSQKAVIKVTSMNDEVDCDKVFELDMYKNTQMLLVMEYYYERGWYLARVACRDRRRSLTAYFELEMSDLLDLMTNRGICQTCKYKKEE